jgi:ABC-type Mn2+/Zn2+ transport system permease subunit
MIDAIIGPFVEFSFMRRALVGCLALSLGAPPIGVFLMLRRMSLMGDAMSHAVLPGAAIGYLLLGLSLQAMSLGGFIAGLAVALAAGLVARSTMLREDASLAGFYLVSLAAGVLIVSVRGSNIDLLHVLFGTVLALDDAALILVASIATVSLIVLAVIYRPLVLECFDPQFLRSASSWSSPTHLIFLVLVVLNLVAGFQSARHADGGRHHAASGRDGAVLGRGCVGADPRRDRFRLSGKPLRPSSLLLHQCADRTRDHHAVRRFLSALDAAWAAGRSCLEPGSAPAS